MVEVDLSVLIALAIGLVSLVYFLIPKSAKNEKVRPDFIASNMTPRLLTPFLNKCRSTPLFLASLQAIHHTKWVHNSYLFLLLCE